MSTVAVIGTFDTKEEELAYLGDALREFGVDVVTVDLSTSPAHHSAADVPREEVCQAGGASWDHVATLSRGEQKTVLARGAAAVVAELVHCGRVDGVVAAGGVQNTTSVAQVMWGLPIGVPKVIVSTVASGSRPFDMVVGTSDITVIPAITDIAGLNRISRTILREAAAAVAGMVLNGSGPVLLAPGDEPVIGVTLMGAINDGAAPVISDLRGHGFEVLSFHSTGVGGRVLEQLIQGGTITAVVDISLHEIVHEVIGGGFCSGATDRLTAAAAAGIPIVAAPGALDFMCYLKSDVPPGWLERQHVWHNEGLAHFALSVEEAERIVDVVIQRLKTATGPVAMVLPRRGLRMGSEPGGAFHHPELDTVILDRLRSGLAPGVRLVEVDDHINSRAFSDAVVAETLALVGPGVSHVA